MKYAIKLQHRNWQEDIDLPWERLLDILAAIYQTPDGPLPDISPLCTWFRRELRGPALATVEIDDIEARLLGDDVLEVEFAYYIREKHYDGLRKRTVLVAA